MGNSFKQLFRQRTPIGALSFFSFLEGFASAKPSFDQNPDSDFGEK